MEDVLLWNYIVSGLRDEDLLKYRFDNKLRCHPHEFGNNSENFLRQRMMQSNTLLDLALESIERWSNVCEARYGETRVGYRRGFLHDTSFEDAHTQRDREHTESIDILLDAVEAAILHQAETYSDWWITNRERLCFNHEGSLLYFAILACTASPTANIDLIGRMLCDSKMLEFDLTYELGTLMQTAFRMLDIPTQDAVMANILTLRHEQSIDESTYLWILQAQAQLIIPIQCHLRSPEVQAVVDAHEKKLGILVRQPKIHSQGGMIGAPFSFEVFLNASDNGVMTLLEHYAGHSDWDVIEADSLVGGEREVGSQLQQASSRHPTRFLRLLSTRRENIPDAFSDDIMDGVATYLAYRYGNLQTNSAWQAVEVPEAPLLVDQILDELEKHPEKWRHQRVAAMALEACANVINDQHGAERLITLAMDFETLREDYPVESGNVNIITSGINMVKGKTVEALMIQANNLQKNGAVFPELLSSSLRRFASANDPAIHALILRRLPYLQSRMFDLGWDLFHLSMRDGKGLWQLAEPCLYYSYHNHFEVVRPLLERLQNEGSGKDLETWGRVSALAAMAQRIDFAEFQRNLQTLNSPEAWLGAANVWTHCENIQLNRKQCLTSIDSGLNASAHIAGIVAAQMDQIFREQTALISVPIELIRRCFSAFENDQNNKNNRLFRFHGWLSAISQLDSELALGATEIYLAYVKKSKPYLHDYENSLTQLMTRLFAEAEEREESDEGAMLQRVVAIQDALLSLGLNDVAIWLKAAERP
jgi:hypothetical protein